MKTSKESMDKLLESVKPKEKKAPNYYSVSAKLHNSYKDKFKELDNFFKEHGRTDMNQSKLIRVCIDHTLHTVKGEE